MQERKKPGPRREYMCLSYSCSPTYPPIDITVLALLLAAGFDFAWWQVWLYAYVGFKWFLFFTRRVVEMPVDIFENYRKLPEDGA